MKIITFAKFFCRNNKSYLISVKENNNTTVIEFGHKERVIEFFEDNITDKDGWKIEGDIISFESDGQCQSVRLNDDGIKAIVDIKTAKEVENLLELKPSGIIIKEDDFGDWIVTLLGMPCIKCKLQIAPWINLAMLFHSGINWIVLSDSKDKSCYGVVNLILDIHNLNEFGNETMLKGLGLPFKISKSGQDLDLWLTNSGVLFKHLKSGASLTYLNNL